MSVIAKIDRRRSGLVDIIICWFGVIATKYANITSTPATYTRNTITASQVDVDVANIVAIRIDIAKRPRAAVIGFGASIIEKAKSVVVLRIDVMIIYKFWG